MAETDPETLWRIIARLSNEKAALVDLLAHQAHERYGLTLACTRWLTELGTLRRANARLRACSEAEAACATEDR